MTLRCLFALLVALVPTVSHAGAWPRGKGSAFGVLSFESTYDRSALTWDDPSEEPPLTRNFLKFYGEYGLTDRYTLGVELEQDYLFAQRQGIVFLTASVVPEDWANRVSVEIGFGERRSQSGPNGREQSEPVIRPALFYGRGFETPWGPGWAGADFKAEYRFDSAEDIYKLDLTLGVNNNDETLYYAQIQTAKFEGEDTAARLLLSRVSRMNDYFWLESGLLAGLVTDESVGLRLAIWAEL